MQITRLFNSSKPVQVLVVEDDTIQQKLIKRILSSDHYQVSVVGSGEEALELLRSSLFDVVVADKILPGISGFELCHSIREKLGEHFLQVILMTASHDENDLLKSLAVGANDFIRKPYVGSELRARIEAAANHKRKTDQLDTAESMLFALARLVEAKDVHTGNHCARLSHVSVVFGRELGLSEDELTALYRGGVLHDLGKLGIPDSILLKEGSLTQEEWQVMRQHTTIGASLCMGLRSMSMTVPIILYHHERWDGSGYPDGLKGEEIPLLARVFQVVDIYDALCSERPYKDALPREEVIRIMEEESHKGWLDPQLVLRFLDILRIRPELFEIPETLSSELGGDIFDEIASTGVLHWDNPLFAARYKTKKV